jgi:hypothetical protein
MDKAMEFAANRHARLITPGVWYLFHMREFYFACFLYGFGFFIFTKRWSSLSPVLG